MASQPQQDDPALRLAPAVARYSDALGVAAEQVLGADPIGLSSSGVIECPVEAAFGC